jgi:hypothetical protein
MIKAKVKVPPPKREKPKTISANPGRPSERGHGTFAQQAEQKTETKRG